MPRIRVGEAKDDVCEGERPVEAPAGGGSTIERPAPREGWCGVYGALSRRMTLPGDTPKAVRQKVLMVGFLFFAVAVNVAGASTQPWLGLAFAGGYAAMLGALLLHRRLSQWFLWSVVVLSMAVVGTWDLYGLCIHYRFWPIFILVIDCLLVVEAPRGMAEALVLFVLVFLLLCEIELDTRSLHLLDLPGSRPYEERRSMVDCQRPPCAREAPGLIPVHLVPQYGVFITDFVLTRWFRDMARRQQEKVAASVGAAANIAESLADFDLAEAERHLEGADLPWELRRAFSQLLANLASYRPFLPSELFPCNSPQRKQAQAPDAGDMPPPAASLCSASVGEAIPGVGGDGAWIALAFTDIRSSTSLWEMSADNAMAEALLLHNDVMRAAVDAARGYEVKTIGDAFMVAFHTTRDAVSFGGAVQAELDTGTPWPEGLQRANMDDGYGVLTVRMGIHCGEVTAQRSVLTGRYDYFGPTVNRAARVEPHGVPGAVTVTAEVLADLEHDSWDLETRFIAIAYDEACIGKGLSQPLQLTALLPHALSARVETVRRIVCNPNNATRPVKPQPLRTLNVQSQQSMWSYIAPQTPPSVRGAVAPVKACVGVVKFDWWYESGGWADAEATFAQRLQIVDAAVRSTGGTLSTVVNSIAAVSWGVHKPCPQHVGESVRFVLQLYRNMGDAASPLFHCGLATGMVGSMSSAASASRHFVTLFGPCVDLAVTLAVAAAEAGACALVASLNEDGESHAQDGFLRPRLRRVDMWAIGECWVEVDELLLPQLLRAEETRVTSTDASKSDASTQHGDDWSAWSIANSARAAANSNPRATSSTCAHLPHALMRYRPAPAKGSARPSPTASTAPQWGRLRHLQSQDSLQTLSIARLHGAKAASMSSLRGQ